MKMTEMNAHVYLIPDFLNWRRDFSGSRGGSWMISWGGA
jgi:hypothetical protein